MNQALAQELFSWVAFIALILFAMLALYAAIQGITWVQRIMPKHPADEDMKEVVLKGGPADGKVLWVHKDTARIILAGTQNGGKYYQSSWTDKDKGVMTWVTPR